MAENEKIEAKAAAEKKPAKVKKSKPSLGSRIAAWFRSVKGELKKIVWASPKSVRHNTIMVLITLLIFAIAVGILDVIFSKFIYILSILL